MSFVALRPVSATPVPEGLRRLRSLVSPYVGIVRAVGEFAAGPDDARLFRVGCRIAEVAPLLGVEVDYRAGGTAPSRDAALAATLGEVAERYSASSPTPDGGVLATAARLGPRAVDPARFALFSSEQYARAAFPFRPFTHTTPVRWVEAFAIPSGAPALLPRQLVHLAWRPERDSGEVPIGYSTSSGAACGCTLEEAVLRGLLELLERAFEEDPGLEQIRGYVDDSGEGRWTVHEAIDRAVAVPVISQALFARFVSREEDAFAMRFIAALRNEFGGHAIRES